MNTTINSLHSHTILLVLVEVTKDLEEILLRYVWYELYHIIQNE